MAKKFLTFIVVLFAFITFVDSTAKARSVEEWQFGIHVDPAVNWFFSDSPYLTNSGGQFGFRGGVEVTWNPMEVLGVLSGVSYDLRMADLKYADTAMLVHPKYGDPLLMTKGSVLETSAQYLYIPIGIKLRAVEIGYWGITGAVGISCDILLSQRVKSKNMGLQKSVAEDFFTWGYPGYFLRFGAEYSLGGRSAIDMGLAYHGVFSAVAKPGIGKLFYHNLSFRVGFIF